MILPVKSIPAVILIHEGLPSLEKVFEIRQFPTPRLEFAEFSVVNVHMLEIENHVDLVAIELHCSKYLFLVFDEWHLTDAEGIVVLQDLANVLQILVQAWPVRIVFVSRLPRRTRVFDWYVRESLIFADEIDYIHSEAITTLVEPKADDVVDCLTDWMVLPIEIGLLGGVQMQIVLVCEFVILPGTTWTFAVSTYMV